MNNGLDERVCGHKSAEHHHADRETCSEANGRQDLKYQPQKRRSPEQPNHCVAPRAFRATHRLGRKMPEHTARREKVPRKGSVEHGWTPQGISRTPIGPASKRRFCRKVEMPTTCHLVRCSANAPSPTLKSAIFAAKKNTTAVTVSLSLAAVGTFSPSGCAVTTDKVVERVSTK